MIRRLTTEKQRQALKSKKEKKLDKLIKILITKGVITQKDLK